MSVPINPVRTGFRARAVALALGVLCLATAAFPQAGPPPAAEQKAQQPPATPPAPAPPPAPEAGAGEGFRWGLMEGHSEIEIGYRWVSGAGNRDMYRSMVNLGEGPKLLRSSLSLRSDYGAGGLFDRLDVSIDNWGGDPYNTVRLRAGRAELYEFRADYRNLNYYNFIPSYANPLLGTGSLLGQHSLNVTSRGTDLELKLFPTRRVRPFVGYSRLAGFGPGLTTFRASGNEFLLDTRWRYAADEYRGGLEVELPNLALTFEQGVKRLRNDTGVDSGSNRTSNFSRTVLGSTITLDSLDRGYHERITMPVSKVLVRFTPWSTLSLTGRYVYSVADLDSSFRQIESGSLASIEDLLFYKTSADSFDTRARRPGRSGGFLVEYAPFARLTVTDQFDARGYDISGSALLTSTFYGIRPISSLPDGRNDISVERSREAFFGYDQFRNQAEFELDILAGLSIRAGHRRTSVEITLEDVAGKEQERRSGSFVQQTALTGVSFRRGRWLRLGLDYESNQTDRALTRTDLLDHDQFRLSWQVRPSKSISASGRIGFMRNSNPAADVDLRAHNRSYAFEVTFDPSERFSLSADYTRANLYSSIAILLPQTLLPDRSVFDERSHAAGGALGLEIYRGTRIDLGYRGISSTGNFPLNYHLPFAALSIPLHRRLVWRSGWQYYGYNEKGAALEDHRTHLLTFSLAYRY